MACFLWAISRAVILLMQQYYSDVDVDLWLLTIAIPNMSSASWMTTGSIGCTVTVDLSCAARRSLNNGLEEKPLEARL